jgi:hypothetical protein
MNKKIIGEQKNNWGQSKINNLLKTPENFFAYNKINDLCEYAPPKIND